MKAMKLLAAALFIVAPLPAQNTSTDATRVVFVSSKDLRARLLKAPQPTPGTATLDVVHTPEYATLVARRTTAGLAEVHKSMIDVWYVMEGGGTLVTGGSLDQSTEATPGEFRGPGVSGGETRHIAAGDIVTIPAGVPHWVQKVDGRQLVYLVVKVASPK